MIHDRRGDRVVGIINGILLTLILVVTAYPMIYVVSASFSDPDYVNRGMVILLPRGFNLDGYDTVFKYGDIWLGYRNTLLYTFGGTLINLFATLPAAYALSRKDLVGRSPITWFFALTLFFSGGMIPAYLNISRLGMLGTVWAVLLPGTVYMSYIIICRTFFSDPMMESLREAAEIDGCSNTHTFLRIILPLSAPLIAVMALFYGIGHWNEYFLSMLYLAQKPELWPLQLILRGILINTQLIQRMIEQMGESAVEFQRERGDLTQLIKYTSIIVSMVPMMILYPFVQRYFVKGVMIGAIKG